MMDEANRSAERRFVSENLIPGREIADDISQRDYAAYDGAPDVLHRSIAVPERFTVKDKKSVVALLRVCGAFLLLVSLGGAAAEIAEPENTLVGVIGFYLLSAALGFFSVFCIFHSRRTLTVDGNTLTYRPTFGAARTVDVSELAGMKIGANGRKLYGADGRVLLRFEDNQENAAFLLQYLQENGVGLMA